MKTSQNHSHGSVKSSIRAPSFKNSTSSSEKNEKISKYFPPIEDSANSQFDSPYKNLSEITYKSKNEDPNRDFRTPKPIKVQKKIQNKKTNSKKQNKPKSKSNSKSKNSVNKNPIFKATQDNFGISDVNPEHLQMALALSKSTYAVEYPEHSKNTEDLPTFLSPEKIPKRKTTLEKYGFKSRNSQLKSEFKQAFVAVPKKNSKFRFITPTLKTRTAEERQTIIASKISLVLLGNKNCTGNDYKTTKDIEELHSEFLRTLKATNSVFAVSDCTLATNNDRYYKKTLNISPRKAKCGCLLREWADMAGREKSPVRHEFKYQENSTETPIISLTSSEDSEDRVNINSQQDTECSLTSVKTCNSSQVQSVSTEYSSMRDCVSPDLFESENEMEYSPKSSNIEDDFSQSLLSPSKKSQKSRCSQSSWSGSPQKYTSDTNLKGSAKRRLQEFLQDSDNSDAEYLNLIKESVAQISEDENTEELYLNSLKDREKLDLNPTQKLPINKNKRDVSPPPKALKQEIIDLTFSSSSNDSMDKIRSKLNFNVGVIEEKNADADMETNFEMSPLQLKDSNEEAVDFEAASPRTDHNFSISVNGSARKSSEEVLNITDYVYQFLNQNNDKTDKDEINSFLNNCSNRNDFESNSQDVDDEFGSQASCSQESIIISDEELNYSSIHSKKSKCDKYFYNLSDAEEISEVNKNASNLIDMDEITNIHSALKNKYVNKSISNPIHNRVSELRNELQSTTSVTTALLEDSFNAVLENTNIWKTIENKADEELPKNHFTDMTENCDHKKTPEKSSEVLVAPLANTDVTPDNNLIIKTKNVTPLANYDEMNTPSIAKELHKFGLKPLKRRRGIQLLKYLYESTHPYVGPSENEIHELSSDEDDKKRLTKKRRKTNGSVLTTSNSEYNNGGIEIIGNDLIQKENLDDLIFERKYSVKISSCRIPLQIVWHNFLSENGHIRESMLLYEPLQLEVLHTMIKEQTGCKFHIQDLLTFFDRKCITIRTAQGSQRGKGRT